MVLIRSIWWLAKSRCQPAHTVPVVPLRISDPLRHVFGSENTTLQAVHL
jgi:hypothetical protein